MLALVPNGYQTSWHLGYKYHVFPMVRSLFRFHSACRLRTNIFIPYIINSCTSILTFWYIDVVHLSWIVTWNLNLRLHYHTITMQASPSQLHSAGGSSSTFIPQNSPLHLHKAGFALSSSFSRLYSFTLIAQPRFFTTSCHRLLPYT